jgi:hypothetical protein
MSHDQATRDDSHTVMHRCLLKSGARAGAQLPLRFIASIPRKMTLNAHWNDQSVYTTTPMPPALPTEIWLQILEQADTHEAIYLWTTVRFVCLNFKDYVERVFASTYLPQSTISLALPRRDPTTGAPKWPGPPIPRARIIFTFDKITSNQQRVLLRSPVILGLQAEETSVEELRRTGALPKERLQTAPPWVNIGRNSSAGLSMDVSGQFDWDNERMTWTWELDWRKLVTQFYLAKEKSKHKRSPTATIKYRPVRSQAWR